MSKIEENLYLGNYLDALGITKLKDKGITDIINCTVEHENFYPKTFKYLRLFLFDSTEEDISYILRFTDRYIKDILKNPKRKVLVHCHAGISRSASVVISYLMYKYNLSYEDAYDRVLEKRDIIDPNPRFKQILKGK